MKQNRIDLGKRRRWMEADKFEAWVGRQEAADDVVTPGPVAGLSAMLDRDDPPPALGDALPPLWHWLYFLPRHRQSEIGPDGHARRGGFLPPVALPRRMWAGGRLAFATPLRIGEAIRRVSTIKSVQSKSGRSGPLVFVTVLHEVFGSFGGAISEEHDIVYREAPKPDDVVAKPPARTNEAWLREVRPDETLLFRYSALTFNAHRIHYDRRYVMETEGYPGLIVHGPLIATLLAELARRSVPRRLTSFAFRAASPLFDIDAFSVCGAPTADGEAEFWARSAEGVLAMEAKVRFEGAELAT
jgi:3-methylfumaryl-CoA hydratase